MRVARSPCTPSTSSFSSSCFPCPSLCNESLPMFDPEQTPSYFTKRRKKGDFFAAAAAAPCPNSSCNNDGYLLFRNEETSQCYYNTTPTDSGSSTAFPPESTTATTPITTTTPAATTVATAPPSPRVSQRKPQLHRRTQNISDSSWKQQQLEKLSSTSEPPSRKRLITPPTAASNQSKTVAGLRNRFEKGSRPQLPRPRPEQPRTSSSAAQPVTPNNDRPRKLADHPRDPEAVPFNPLGSTSKEGEPAKDRLRSTRPPEVLVVPHEQEEGRGSPLENEQQLNEVWWRSRLVVSWNRGYTNEKEEEEGEVLEDQGR